MVKGMHEAFAGVICSTDRFAWAGYDVKMMGGNEETLIFSAVYGMLQGLAIQYGAVSPTDSEVTTSFHKM